MWSWSVRERDRRCEYEWGRVRACDCHCDALLTVRVAMDVNGVARECAFCDGDQLSLAGGVEREESRGRSKPVSLFRLARNPLSTSTHKTPPVFSTTTVPY